MIGGQETTVEAPAYSEMDGEFLAWRRRGGYDGLVFLYVLDPRHLSCTIPMSNSRFFLGVIQPLPTLVQVDQETSQLHGELEE